MAVTVNVKVGFVPSYRFRYSGWCRKMRDDSLAAFSQVKGLEVIIPQPAPEGESLCAEQGYTPTGAVNTLDEADAIAEHFRCRHVDAIILCPLDFGDERSASKIAEILRVPVLLYATREPPALDTPAMARVSDSYCGNLSMASGLYRRKIPFHYAGLFFPDEAEFQTEVQDFVRAVAAIKGLKGARIGQIGVRPMTFETVGFNEVAIMQKFGQNVIPVNLGDIVDAAKSLADDDAAVQATLVDLRAGYPTITVSDSYLLNAAKLEITLADFWTRNKLSGMAISCWPSIRSMMGISVCNVYGRLTGRGMLTACETDVLGTLAMIATYQAALGETLPHFVDWTIQHREDANQLLAWHCGNAPMCLAKEPGKVALRSRLDMKGEYEIPEHDPQAGLAQFQLKPGKVTFCRLAEYDGEWKMLIAAGDVVPSDEDLAGTWSWVRVRDHAHLYRTLVEEGFIHHASMIHGDLTRPLVLACKFLGVETVVVQ